MPSSPAQPGHADVEVHAHNHDLHTGADPSRIAKRVVTATLLVLLLICLVAVPYLAAANPTSKVADYLGRHITGTHTTIDSTAIRDSNHYATVTLDGEPHELLVTQPWAAKDPLHAGEKVIVARASNQHGNSTWHIVDRDRTLWLVILAGLLIVALAVVAGAKGLRAAVGIAAAGAIILGFILPTIAAGGPPIPTALAGSALILFAVVYLAHGITYKSSTALLGTLTAMAYTLLVSWLAVKALHLTGIAAADDENGHLDNINLQGLMLAGFIIGSLGVLNDVTIAQASTVFELAEHHSPLTAFRKAMEVGKDHIASATYTLVLAYTGSALPLLLILHSTDYGLRSSLSLEIITTEITRSLTGALGLILSVPLTTALAALTCQRTGKTATQRHEGAQPQLTASTTT